MNRNNQPNDTNLVEIEAILYPFLEVYEGLEIPPRALRIRTRFRTSRFIKIFDFLSENDLRAMEAFLDQIIRHLARHVS